MKKSKSPYADIYHYTIDHENEKNKIDKFLSNDRTTVVVQGLGFVGSAMVAALSMARDQKNGLLYNVVGIDLGDEKNYWKIGRVNDGKPPVVSNDKSMDIAYADAKENKNLLATYSEYVYSRADIVVVDIHLDIKKKEIGDAYNYDFTYESYKKAIEAVSTNIQENTLVLIETTVPPGTTEKVIYPILKENFEKKGLDINKVYLAHSYERVMPGSDYLNSIINYYRVFSGINEESKIKAKEFLKSFINTNEFPLSELHSTTASEMSKVLENSYRAMNIAFMQEWTEYAQKAEVDLFEVINAIKVRPTHKNIMLPGFGVGGYCLTKDALLADWSYNNLFDGNEHLEMSLNAININDLMPNYTFGLLQDQFVKLDEMNIAILGISYLNDVADTRYSPSQLFYDKCVENNMNVYLHDPIVEYWEEKDITINKDLSSLLDKNIDIIVLTVRHKEYLELSTDSFLTLFPQVKIIVDAFNIISDEQAKELFSNNIKVIGVGKGHWKQFERGDENE